MSRVAALDLSSVGAAKLDLDRLCLEMCLYKTHSCDPYFPYKTY